MELVAVQMVMLMKLDDGYDDGNSDDDDDGGGDGVVGDDADTNVGAGSCAVESKCLRERKRSVELVQYLTVAQRPNQPLPHSLALHCKPHNMLRSASLAQL